MSAAKEGKTDMEDPFDFRGMTEEDFAALGADDVAYIKRLSLPTGIRFGIFAGDGREIGLADDFETAAFAAARNDFLTVTLH